MPTARLLLTGLAATLLTASAALAQAPAAVPAPAPTPAPAPAAAPTVPDAMPFDVPYGMPISLDQAHKALTAAAADARKRNWKMSITVVDPAGNLVAHATMDGTQYGSIAISQGKARTAALYRRPSKVFEDRANSGGPSVISLLALTQGAASEGGFPIVIDGKLVGAIGVSGGTSGQDALIARVGLDALGIK